MAEVEGDPSTARPALALVGDDHLDLRPGTALDELRDHAALRGLWFATSDRVAVTLEQLEQPLVAERRHLHRLAEGGPSLSFGQGRKQRDSDHEGRRVGEGADGGVALAQLR